MITTFFSSLFNTLIVACIAIAIVVLLRLMCNNLQDEARVKFIRFYDLLFKTLGFITGAMIVIFFVIVFIPVEPFPIWFQNLITLFCIILVSLALLAKRKK